jgi:hypothetical protein
MDVIPSSQSSPPPHELIESAPSARRYEPSFFKLLMLALVALLSVSAIFSVATLVACVRHTGDVTSPESAVTTLALNLAHTGRLYSPLDQPPYTPVAYGPVLYLGMAIMAKILQLHFLGLLVAGRLAALLSFLLLCAALYWAARRSGCPDWVAILPAVLVFSDYSFARWNATVRPDVPAILLSVLCIALAIVPSRKAMITAGACAAIAVFLKLSYVAAPGAVLMWILWSRRYSYAVWFCVTAVAIGCCLLAFFVLRGDPILTQIMVMRNVLTSRQGVFSLLTMEWQRDATKLLLAFCLTGLAYPILAGIEHRKEALLGLYLGLSLLIGVVTSFNSGASSNYYLEPRAAAMLIVPLGIWNLAQFWPRAPLAFRIFASAVVLFAFIMQPLSWFRLFAQIRQEGNDVRAIVPAVSGNHVLSTDSYLAALGKDPEMLNPYLVTQLEARGHWSSRPLVDSIMEQKYDVVVFGVEGGHVEDWRGQPRFNRPTMHAIGANYVPFCANNRYLVMVPSHRPGPPGLQQALKAGCQHTDSASWLGN